jgi:hypothetical protein
MMGVYRALSQIYVRFRAEFNVFPTKEKGVATIHCTEDPSQAPASATEGIEFVAGRTGAGLKSIV